MTGAIIVNEIITTLATQPSDEEWRCIREFKQRTRELAENTPYASYGIIHHHTTLIRRST